MKLPIYLFSDGSAQTEAASMWVTDFPFPVRPHKSVKNGSASSGLIRTLAKDAASINLISNLSCCLIFFTCSYQVSLSPFTRMASKSCLNFASPSNMISSLYGKKPSPIHPSFPDEYCISMYSSFRFSTSDKYLTRCLAVSDVTAIPFLDNPTILDAVATTSFGTIISCHLLLRLKAIFICSSPV